NPAVISHRYKMTEEQGPAGEEMQQPLAAVKEENGDVEAEAFLALLHDDRILLGGFDLDEAIAEAERAHAGQSASPAVEEMAVGLELEGEDPVSDAEGEDRAEERRGEEERGGEGNEGGAYGRAMARVRRLGMTEEEKNGEAVDMTVTHTRLARGRPANTDNWTSEELKELYDGVKKSGTSKASLVRLYNLSEFIQKKRSIEDVYRKVEDLREMNKEHRETAIVNEKRDAEIRGPIRFEEMDKLAFVWTQQLQKLQNARVCTRRHDHIREQLMNFFTPRVRQANTMTTIDEYSGSAPRPIRWSRLYRIARFCFTSGARTHDLPNKIGVNAMEAAVLLTIMNDIEKETREALTERRRQENGSFFLALARQDYRLFELDVPATDFGQPFLDPLKMDEWSRAVLERGTEEEEEEGDEAPTYDDLFPEAPKAKPSGRGKKRGQVIADDGEVLEDAEADDRKRPFIVMKEEGKGEKR
ncbi:hypothetical protein PFISCL1PPCAC_18504, partial [Pristionchus fissidentatus]